MGPEKVHIMGVAHSCVAYWKRTAYQGGLAYAAFVTVGTLPDSRWYVWVIGMWSDDKARLYDTETEARDVADRWKQRIGGGWEQIACDQYKGWRPGEREQATPAAGQPPGSGSTGRQV